MSEQIQAYLAKHIREKDDFIVRAAKCMGAFMTLSETFESEEKFSMATYVTDQTGVSEHLAFMVKTDAVEFLDVLLDSFINNVEPFGDGATEESIDHANDDLAYLKKAYLREKAKGYDVGYAEIVFVIDRNNSSIMLSCGNEFELKVNNLEWIGTVYPKSV